MFTNRFLNYRKTSTQTNIKNLISPYLVRGAHALTRTKAFMKQEKQRKTLQEMWGNIGLLSLPSDIIVVTS